MMIEKFNNDIVPNLLSGTLECNSGFEKSLKVSKASKEKLSSSNKYSYDD